ncbi:ROK family transcriptional regulator [Georgenia faecalis]|uniref:ROK family protein n=1 Tax=Georgenia faecalis TaxID=2483799 RepID=A0ABV9D522_9MICO|nr:ROK family transcriptional regulator [Georgenia faecalis]
MCPVGVTTSLRERAGAGEVLQLLRDGLPRTKSDIAAHTGQARSTITVRLEQLLATDLVSPGGSALSTGGRPPATFVFNPSAKVVLAVDLGAVHARMAVTDLSGTVLAESDEPLVIADGPDVVLPAVVAWGRALLAETGRQIEDLAGVGVGVPGPVEHRTGRPVNPPIMPGWDGYDVPGHLGCALDAPVLVDNDVNLMALGERAAVWPEEMDLLFVKVATGIGSGIISDGALRRGSRGAAGDLGHIAVREGPRLPCRCGNIGCLEAVASGSAVAAALQVHGVEAHSTRDVVDLVRTGDLQATRAVRQAGRDIGGVLAGCVNLLNPSIIVVGGMLADAGEQLIAGIREVVYQDSLPLATQHLKIVDSRTAGRAAVLGASTMAIEHVLSPDAVEAMLA